MHALELPNTPTLMQKSLTYDSAIVQWTAPSDNGGSDITGYEITISPAPSISCTGTCTVSGGILQYTFTGLDHTQQYAVSVAAINCVGTGGSAHILLCILMLKVGNMLMNVIFSPLLLSVSNPPSWLMVMPDIDDNMIFLDMEWKVLKSRTISTLPLLTFTYFRNHHIIH